MRAGTPEPAAGPLDLESRLDELEGVGPARSAALASVGLERVRDLLLLVPRRLEERGAPLSCAAAREALGRRVIVRGRVASPSFSRFGRRSSLRFALGDESGQLEVCFFNQPWQRERFPAGQECALEGRVQSTPRGPALVAPRSLHGPELERATLLPVLAPPAGIGQQWLRGLRERALARLGAALVDPLPAAELERLRLPELGEAARELCLPSSRESFAAARRRVLLEEVLALQARLRARSTRSQVGARALHHDEASERELRALFPFEPTAGQARIMSELRRDLARTTPMRRLVQGDVGSGKTALGFYACAAAARAGAQCAFLAPTELLAEQHMAGLAPLLARAGLRAALLTGSLPARSRRAVESAVESGEVDVLFGTHALLGPELRFRSLALAVIDEQQRFGVAQRARLVEKGEGVHLLLMTATPIPRTLALTLYGDLDVSVLREKPPGRGPVRTRWLRGKDRERLPAFLAERLAAGEQVYWVVPRIGERGAGEEEQDVDVDVDVEGRGEAGGGAERRHRRLCASPLAAHGIELVHGRLEAAERARRLERFRGGAARLLVATTLIEVGVDVPAATVMVIEEAERLGLAQLHQLRGRVGRGPRDSWCLLSGKPAARERLALLERTQDGFEIAEEDLRQRGMGELCGLRQAGGTPSDPEAELELLVAARDLLAADPGLVERYARGEGSVGPAAQP